jgi:hypothetical protein
MSANKHSAATVNIYPREIEDALALHPAVAHIVVFGVPDEEMGQRVHAVAKPAVPGAGAPALASELIDFCRSRIEHYKAPRPMSFEDELPRLPSSKMLAPAAHGPLPLATVGLAATVGLVSSRPAVSRPIPIFSPPAARPCRPCPREFAAARPP